MSDFASNFITYITASVFAGACLLAGVELDAPAPARIDDNPAAATAISLVQENAPPRFEEAELESVVFTASGLDRTPSFTAEPRRPEGTVTGRVVNLRAGPGTNFTIAGRAEQGDRLAVTGQRDGIWHEVMADAGRVWIHGNFFDAPEAGALAQNR